MVAPLVAPQSMSMALANFNAQQEKIAAIKGNMQALVPQVPQAMPVPQQVPQPPPVTQYQGNVQQGYGQYMNRLATEEQKQRALAKTMSVQEMQAGMAAASSAAQMSKTKNFLASNAKGIVPSGSPLDLIAVGIRAYKGKKAQKNYAQQAAAAAKAKMEMEAATRKRERAEDNAQYLSREQMKPVERGTVADFKTSYFYEKQDGKTLATMSPQARAGHYAIQREDEARRNEGTGQPVLNTTPENDLQKAYLAGQKAIKGLGNTMKGYDPRFMTVMGKAEGLLGNVQDMLGMSDADASKFNARKETFFAGLFEFSNELIKARSGAAVTAQEWARFKKEFPVGQDVGPAEFERRITQYVERMTIQQAQRRRQGGWMEDEDGALVPSEGAAPLEAKPMPRALEEMKRRIEMADAAEAEKAAMAATANRDESAPALQEIAAEAQKKAAPKQRRSRTLPDGTVQTQEKDEDGNWRDI